MLAQRLTKHLRLQCIGSTMTEKLLVSCQCRSTESLEPDRQQERSGMHMFASQFMTSQVDALARLLNDGEMRRVKGKRFVDLDSVCFRTTLVFTSKAFDIVLRLYI